MALFQPALSFFHRQGFRASLVKLHSILLDHWLNFRFGLATGRTSESRDLTIYSRSIGSGEDHVLLLAAELDFAAPAGLSSLAGLARSPGEIVPATKPP